MVPGSGPQGLDRSGPGGWIGPDPGSGPSGSGPSGSGPGGSGPSGSGPGGSGPGSGPGGSGPCGSGPGRSGPGGSGPGWTLREQDYIFGSNFFNNGPILTNFISFESSRSPLFNGGSMVQ